MPSFRTKVSRAGDEIARSGHAMGRPTLELEDLLNELYDRVMELEEWAEHVTDTLPTDIPVKSVAQANGHS